MLLKLLCGRSGSGKTTYILNSMADEEASVYIVPEQFTFSAEQKLIENFGIVGLGAPQVLSFNRLADRVFSVYGAPEFISDNASYEMLVNYCTSTVSPEKLKLFDGLVKRNELSQTASGIITTFKKYRISSEMLRNAIEHVNDELLKKKLSDSLYIYEKYSEALCDAGISDQHDKLSIAAEILSEEACDFFKNKNIYIDQFSDFDPSEYECIKVMLKKASSVTVALCTDFSDDFGVVNKTSGKLQELAKKVGAEILIDRNFSGAMIDAKPMIKHLEKVYFADETIAFAGTDESIKVFCGKDRYSEMHFVARNIVNLVREKNLRFRDISIIAREAQQYKAIIDRVFPFYDIPVFIDRKMPLSGHSISAFVTALLEIAIGGYNYENMFSYIKNPFSPISSDDADLLENYCLAAGIRPYSWNKPFTFITSAYDSSGVSGKNNEADEYVSDLNKLREAVYLPIETLVGKLKKKSTAKELCIHLFDFFESIKLEEKVKKYASKLEESGENLYALQTMQVYNILIDIFDDVCSVLGDKIITLKEFYSVITAGLGAVEIGTIPTSSDCVTVGSIDRIKGHGAKIVFLVGVNGGVFPATASEPVLFSDDDIKELSALGIEMPPSLAESAQMEQLLVYDSLTCAGEKLYISYASADESSNPLIPSEIVERILSLFPDITFEEDIINDISGMEIITTKKAVFDKLLSKIRAFERNGEPLSDELRGAAHFFSKDNLYSTLLYRAINLTEFTNESVTINPELVEKVTGEEMKTSISRLETYNKCPFSYFAKYILKLEPKKHFELTTSDSGSFLHDFLERFSLCIASSKDMDGEPLSWKNVDDEFIKRHTPGILRETLNSVNERMFEIPRIKALFNRLCRTAERSVYAIRRHIVNSDFIPMGYEISFDENGDFKPIKITLEDGKKITLRGRIDRADKYDITLENGEKGSFVRIVDYKSTGKTLSLSDVYNGIQLQLFVYLSALCDNGYSPAGILYCNLSDPLINVLPGDSEEIIDKKRNETKRMSGIVLSENGIFDHMGGSETISSKKLATAKNFNSMFRHLNKLISKTAEGIYAGNFPIECQSDMCKYCDYSGLCSFDISFSGCKVKELDKLKEDEIWNLLEKEEQNNESDN